ncbi:MAG: vitamin B12-dependent ribonucleotide reductase, partial [Deltaproteobacteria bacterium]
GEVIFEQKDVEVPSSWSQMATNVVVQKYFHGQQGTPERETSVKQLIERVARTILEWGRKGNYFEDEEQAEIFYMELTHLLVNQMAAFNSPVWFNVGIEEHPQCSACFINSVQDSMDSILTLAKTEGMLFKYGSGTGTNLSPLRSSRERLSSGGWASGPVSFMKGFDAFAGVIRSGGKTRRAAKMVVLDIDHPDIVEYITCKAREEQKAWALIDAGYDGSFNGEAYASVFFQNANNSVRVTDAFMKAVLEDEPWHTRERTTGKIAETHRARDLMRLISEAAHLCGDPGLQFDTTVNEWHTCPNSGRINSSNPCGEYVFLDDTACNLSSLNLMKFRRPDGSFDVEKFTHAVSVMILAQEILVDNASYPTEQIEKNSHDFRPLGLGYTNLGALLMANGLPYDSAEARAMAAAITALMGGAAYKTSAEIAGRVGPFPAYPKNAEAMLRVIKKHRNAVEGIEARLVPEDLLEAARQVWDDAVSAGKKWGFKNAQVTVIAPTGTISFLMDCDTTGIEPDIALVKYKNLVGGGLLKMINHTVPEALTRLGYSEKERREILEWIEEHDTIEGAPHLKPEHLPVFDCAFKPLNGKRAIHYRGHVEMMAAVQPFLSGAISKTVNLPNEATVEDIEQVYIDAWKKGLKAIAIYRDGSKRIQPLTTGKKKEQETAATPRKGNGKAPLLPGEFKPVRRRLPDERHSITHKFSIAGHEGYITVGMYEDGTPGEIFIVMSKEGSTVSGLMDSLATTVSLALQYGVPLDVFVKKFAHTRFEPAGYTNNPEIPIAKSITDYIFRWLARKFLTGTDANPKPEKSISELEEEAMLLNDAGRNGTPFNPQIHTMEETREHEKQIFNLQSDAPPCFECGSIMIRSGACYKCPNCGAVSGCS